jgi:hypothetical protein
MRKSRGERLQRYEDMTNGLLKYDEIFAHFLEDTLPHI